MTLTLNNILSYVTALSFFCGCTRVGGGAVGGVTLSPVDPNVKATPAQSIRYTPANPLARHPRKERRCNWPHGSSKTVKRR